MGSSGRQPDEHGFTDVKIGGYSPFGCSESDDTCTEFTAKRGDRAVRGVVGCGYLFKGCTVRFE